MSHPCETCLRWPECNGVDWGSCPDSKAEVLWSLPGPCPITPEQFWAIYEDEEDEDGQI